MSTNTKIEWTDTTGCAAPSGIARPRSRGDANSSDDPGFVDQGKLYGRVVAVIYGTHSP